MRDLLYHGFWVVLLPVSFYSAHLGILLWVWVALLPPVDLMYGSLGVILPFNKLVAASVFLVLLIRPGRKQFYFDFFMGVVAAYAIVVTLSYLLAPYASSSADAQYDKFWKVLVLFALITGLMFTRHRLHQLALVIAITFGFYMAKEGLIFLLTVGNRQVQGAGVFGDNNALAMSILMAIPLMLYVANYTATYWIRLGIYITIGLGVVTVIATYSRGGFVGLVALGVMLLKGNKNKIRTIVLIAVISLVLYSLMPENYVARIDTIKEAGTDESFMIRLVSWKVNFLMALDHPLLGGGPYASIALQNWFAYVEKSTTFLFSTPVIYRTFVAHSIYFQALGDTGFLGLFFFLLMLGTALILTIRTQRIAGRDAELGWAVDLARSTQISLVMYLVCGALLSNVYFEVLYILLALISRNYRTAVEATVSRPVPARSVARRAAAPAFGRAL